MIVDAAAVAAAARFNERARLFKENRDPKFSRALLARNFFFSRRHSSPSCFMLAADEYTRARERAIV